MEALRLLSPELLVPVQLHDDEEQLRPGGDVVAAESLPHPRLPTHVGNGREEAEGLL